MFKSLSHILKSFAGLCAVKNSFPLWHLSFSRYTKWSKETDLDGRRISAGGSRLLLRALLEPEKVFYHFFWQNGSVEVSCPSGISYNKTCSIQIMEKKTLYSELSSCCVVSWTEGRWDTKTVVMSLSPPELLEWGCRSHTVKTVLLSIVKGAPSGLISFWRNLCFCDDQDTYYFSCVVKILKFIFISDFCIL